MGALDDGEHGGESKEARSAVAMRARRTHFTNRVLTHPSGNEDNDLWVYMLEDPDETTTICSVWEPTPQERVLIASGQNIRLCLRGSRHPPVSMDVVDEPLGKPPESP
jgi:hypothetical protein